MADMPNQSHMYPASYSNMGSVNVPLTAGTTGERVHVTSYPAQMGPMPVYRTAIAQPPGSIPMCQPGQPMAHTAPLAPNPGALQTASGMRFSGQMLPPGVSVSPAASMGFKRLLTEMRARQFDSIRFAAYRTASKLRYIQQRTLFGTVDLWRVVETFREFGLHQITESNASLDYASAARLLTRIYSHVNHTGGIDPTAGKPGVGSRPLDPATINSIVDLLLGWLVYALDLCASGRLTVTGLKIALSVLANAKPADKFRYHFTLLSDPSGALIPAKFEAYLQDLLKLPVSVFEGPNFFYNPQAAQAMLSGRSKNILIEEFLDRMLADPGPQLLVWLTIFHRLAAVENVRHGVRCEACKREPICGLRYKCTRCPHYNLCQDCFWTGVTTDQHTNAHDVKEYSSSSKSHSRQFGHSLRKSFHLSRLTGSATQTGSISSNESSSLVTTGSQRHGSTGQAAFKRAPLGSIFEWNSAPSSVDANGFTNNNNGSVMTPPGPLTSIDTGPGPLPYRPQMPVTAVRSPLTHRRLQQLNPLFLSAPSNPTGHPFPNPNVMMTQSPIYATGPMATLTYPSDGQMMRMANPVTSLMQPVGYNPIQGRGSNTMDGDRHPTFPQTPVLDARQMLNRTSADIPQQILSPPGYMMGTPVYRPAADNLSNRTPSEPWSTSTSGMNAPQPQTIQPNDLRQPTNMVNSTTSAMRNADTKCREEHQLIARYAAQLAAASAFNTEFEKFGDVADSPHTQKQLIAELQAKNRKILKEIERLRVEQQKQAAIIAAARSNAGAGATKADGSNEFELLQERTLSPNALAQLNRLESYPGPGSSAGGGGGAANSSTSSGENPKLVSELQALRQRKDELESRMNNLQRNRTELMLQLETLVRLLSVSGGPVQGDQPRQHSLDLSELNVSDLSPSSSSLLPSTPSASTRFRHQSRIGAKPPENPPRRSSSLCQTSTDRVPVDRERYTARHIDDGKLTEKKQLSTNPLLDTSFGSSKLKEKSLIRSELMRKSLLSPTSDSRVDSAALRFRSNDIAAVLTDRLTSTSTTSDALLEKFENLLKQTDSSQPFSKRNLASARSRSGQHSGASPNRSKLGSFGSSASHGNGHTAHYTDSGSEGYLYSDPEMGFSGPTHASGNQTSSSNNNNNNNRRRDPGGRTRMSGTASRPRTADESEREEGGSKSRLGAASYTDNYEYAGLIAQEAAAVVHRRTLSGIGMESGTSGELVAAPKQQPQSVTGLDKSRIV